METRGSAFEIALLSGHISTDDQHKRQDWLDVALEALREGWERRKLKRDALWHLVAVNRVAKVMRPNLERLTV